MVKSLLHDLSNESAIVSPDRLDTFAVHLVWPAWLRPEHSRVPLLVHEQVREVHLLELKLDRLDEEVADVGCRFLSNP